MTNSKTDTAKCSPCIMTEEGMKKIIKKNKHLFSFYNGKYLQFDYLTGEIIRWDNSQLELIKRIKRFGNEEQKTFIYGVPLIV